MRVILKHVHVWLATRHADKLIAGIRIQELYKHPTVLFPLLLGTAIAWSEAGTIDWSVFAVSIIITYFITNGTFMSNEYFDYETDRINIERVGGDRVGITTTGGTRVLAGPFTKRAGSNCIYTLLYRSNYTWDTITVPP